MKKIFLLTALFFSIHGFAQKDGKIVLNKGQKITAVTSSSMDADMSMGMQMKNITSSTNVLIVLSDDSKNYSLSNTVTKLNLSFNAMGQELTYDSEKPGDKDSELGKQFSNKVNVSDTLLVDKISGDVAKKSNSPERPENTDDSNPLTGMLGSMGGDFNADLILNGAFFIVPKGKKAGDTWTDSTSEKNMKTTKNYTIKSIDKNIATILVNGTVTGNGETEMQGSSISFEMNTKNKGEITVDITTGLVSRITTDADIAMTMDVMGQSVPVTSKLNSSIIYQ